MVTATVALTTAFPEPMKASAMTGRYAHLLDADGFIIPERFEKAFGDGSWAMEEKLDGHRAFLVKRGDAISTDLASIDALPPHILKAARDLPDVTLDGELRVPGGISTDVPNAALASQLVFVVFDVLDCNGFSTRDETYEARRTVLGWLRDEFMPDQSAIVLAPQFPPTWASVKAIWGSKGEGAILKRKSSRYATGERSSEWVKVKRLEQHTVTIIGFVAGKRGPTARTVFRFDDGATGRCKTQDRAVLTTKNPAAYFGRRLVVQCQLRTRGAKAPRHPRWKAWEFDHLAGGSE